MAAPTLRQPALPTYKTAAATLEGQNGAGVRLVGYTFARTLMIAPFMMLGGMSARQAFFWSMLSSTTMSIFVLLRIFDARSTGLMGSASPRRGSSRR